jgi:3-oxoacyl-[acyl-carrier-protein] synthase III
VSVSVRTATRTRARLSVLGAYAPERVVSDAEIETWVETSDEWILDDAGADPADIGIARTVLVVGAETLGVEAIDLVVAHQADSRILDHAAERLGIPSDRLFSNIVRYEPAEAA